MKQSVKQLISLLLVLVMAAALLPVNTMAAQTQSTGQQPPAPAQGEPSADTGDIQVCINPRFSGTVDEEALRAEAAAVPMQAGPASESEYVTEEEAVALLRQSMVKREESFSVTVFTESAFLDSFAIAEAALAHTGNPREGDYLRQQLISCSAGGGSGRPVDGGYCHELSWTTKFDTNAQQEAQVDAAVERILAELNISGASEYEKIKAAYDWVCANVVYDYEHLEDDSYWVKQTAYGALIDGTCVCEGYALLMYRLALELGVDCRIVSGMGFTDRHAWNIARVGDWYYFLDATWDTGIHPTQYSWFLVSGPSFDAHVPMKDDWTFAIDYPGNAFKEQYPHAPRGTDPANPGGSAGDSSATSGACGENARWSFDKAAGRLTISGTGEVYNYLPTTAKPWNHLRTQVREVVVEGTVSRIGAYALSGLDALTGVTIEEGVTSIGRNAMMNCTKLASVTVPGSVTEMGTDVFRGCSLLTSAGPLGSGAAVEFGWTTEIPYHAFENAAQLTSLTLPDTLTTIGRYAFARTGLTQLVVPDSVTLIGRCAFENSALVTAELGSAVEVLGACAFRMCKDLTRITLKSGLQEVGDQALESCVSLKSVAIPDTVTRIGDHGFAGCTALEAVYFLGAAPVFDRAYGDNRDIFLNVTANMVCYYDDSWTDRVMVNYGGTLNWVFRERDSVGEDTLTWEYDASLRQLTIRGSGPMADYFMNRESVSTVPWQEVREEAQIVVLENGITHIGNYAFQNFSQLRQAVIPETVTTIGQSAFEGCLQLPVVELPSGLRSLGRHAFRGAAKLRILVFGPEMEYIRAEALEDCAELGYVFFSGDAVSLGEKALGSKKITVMYPAAKTGWDSAYKGGVYHSWKTYGSAAGEIARGTFGEGLTWVVDGDGVLTVSGTGNIPDYQDPDQELPWRGHRDKIVKIVVDEGIETIGRRAFRGMEYITEVSLPESLVAIQEEALRDCYLLVSLNIPGGVTTIGDSAFTSCSNLQNLNLGTNLVTLGAEVFSGNQAMVQVQLPASLQSIGTNAFGACRNLLRIQADPGSVSFWSDGQGVLYSKDKTTLLQMGAGFQGTYTVNAAATTIGEGACQETDELTHITAPGDITLVAPWAFYGCENLQSVNLGKSLEQIGKDAFARCPQLSQFDFGNRLTEIGEYAFYQCELLRDATFPDTLESIGKGAFLNCALTSVDLGKGLQVLGIQAFDGTELTEIVLPGSLREVGSDVFRNCKQLTRVTIEPGLTYIGEKMFEYCSSLEMAELPDTVTEIRQSAFGDCVNLDSIAIPDSVTKIESAFSGCSALKNVRMSAGLVTLGEYAFYGCGSLERIVLPPTLTEMDANCFGNCAALKEIIIPASLKVQSVSQVLYGTFQGCTGLETVIFLGDAPAIYLQYEIFGGVTATAYYPRDNATWTEEIRKGFGGTINWVPVTIYPMLEDSDTVAAPGSGDAFTVHCTGDLAQLQEVRIDGVPVDPANYTAAEGSTTVTVADAYLQTLASGLHSVRLTYTDGLAVDFFTLEGGNTHMHRYLPTVTEPTCQAQGYTTYTCECGSSYVRDYVDGEHTYTSVVTEPGCLTQGYTTYTCSQCGHSYVDDYVEATGHWHMSGHSVDPTCEEQGYTIMYCSCGDSVKEDFVVPLGHDYQEGICTRCGQKDPSLDHEEEDEEDRYPITGTCGEGLTWSLEEDGTLTVSGAGSMDDYDHMNLPPWNEYADQVLRVVVEGTVSRIGQRAFSNLQQLTSVTIGEGVAEIGDSAFWLSTKLESVTIPASVTTVGMYAFQDCRKLKTAGPVGGGYDIEFGWTEEIPIHAFHYSNCLESAVMPNGIRVIGDYAFSQSGVKQVTLKDGLETIGYSAFGYCNYLTSVEIPASVTLVDAGAFGECLALTDVYFRGAVPETQSNAFTGVTATIWYPANEPSWEKPGLKDHVEGNLTWKSYGDSDKPGDETGFGRRLAGGNRFETAFLVADQMKQTLGIEKYDTVVVASGTNFADALSGSYLAAVKNAPILLSFSADSINNQVKDYIRDNLNPGGTVYILGGESAVPASMETGLEEFTVNRLKGKDRFGTNLAILEEAGVGSKPILVCTGLGFADSLSASAAGLPILLVWKDLTQGQQDFLNSVAGNDLYVIGGTGAVSEHMEEQLSQYGTVRRLAGGSRFVTSVMIAEEFFDAPESAVLAYAWDFPDGLCGGPLAAAMKAPLILTMHDYEVRASEYVQRKDIPSGIILGGEKLIPEDSVFRIFYKTGENQLPFG